MRLLVSVICLVGCSALFAADVEFTSKEAKRAKSTFEKSLKKITDKYVADLQKAKSASFKREDLAEIKRIKEVIESLDSSSASKDAKENKSPIIGVWKRDIAKANSWTFNPDGTWSATATGWRGKGTWKSGKEISFSEGTNWTMTIDKISKDKFTTTNGRVYIRIKSE